MNDCDMTLGERYELLDFWKYCESVREEMRVHTKNPKEDLPLSNRMICYAFAAMIWKGHKEAVVAENRIREISLAFVKEQGLHQPFDRHFSATTKPTHMMYGGLERIIKDAGLDDQDKFLAATESDFMKLPRVGKAKLEQLLDEQKRILAHRAFFAAHPEYVTKEDDDER